MVLDDWGSCSLVLREMDHEKSFMTAKNQEHHFIYKEPGSRGMASLQKGEKRTLKVMFVDDEILATQYLKRLLLQEEAAADFQWVGEYQNPYEALDAAQSEEPDVVFLDIEMPEMTGFELAERLWEIRPQLQIVTAYDDYAIKAFEVNALDYLLKPVLPSRLSVTIDRIVKGSLTKPAAVVSRTEDEQEPITLCCLQSLHYRENGEPKHFPWKTLKAPELFAYLIYYRGKTVSKQTLMDLLWPVHDPHKAVTQLHTAIYQIRKMIRMCGLDARIHYHDESYRLELAGKLDVEKWEDRLSKAQEVMPDTLSIHQSIIDMYEGDFLADHRYVWAEPEQERLRLLWLEHVQSVAACHVEIGQHAEAVKIHQQVIERLPYLEDGYVGLMYIYASLHHHSEVRKMFQRMKEVLLGEYEVPLSDNIVQWYKEWEQTVEVADEQGA